MSGGIVKPKRFSCIHCQQRKVKCDKSEPCSNCIKAKIACISRSPAPPKRRKRKSPSSSIPSGLVQTPLEFIVKEPLIEPNIVLLQQDDTKGEVTFGKVKEPDPTYLEPPRMVQAMGNTGYIGGKLWASITEQFDTPAEMFKGFRFDDKYEIPTENILNSSDLVFGTPSTKSLTYLHPKPAHIFRLWQIFLDNVNPVTKILHTPTFQKTIMEACSDIENTPKPVQVTMFAIYALSISSISNEECYSIFGEGKLVLLNKYHLAARQMFTNVMLLKRSNLLYLQAFVIYLLSIQSTEEVRSLWILTGIAVRLAFRVGLHRDGATLGLSPFDVEMRRRLWWQIVILDIRIAELSGSNISVIQNAWDTKLPLNVNDSEITPEMTKPPIEYARATEMMYCLVRYDMFAWLRKPPTNPNLKASKNVFVFHSDDQSAEVKGQVMKEMEDMLNEKYLQHCDSTIPLQLYTIMFGRVLTAYTKLMTNQTMRHLKLGGPQEIRDSIYISCLEVLITYNTFRSTETFKNFLMFDQQYLWFCVVYILIELRVRFLGEHVDQAWQLLDEFYKHQPELITDGTRAINVAIGNLALKSWNKREAEVAGLYQASMPPQFISSLRLERQNFTYKTAVTRTFRRPEEDRDVSEDEQKSQVTIAESKFDGPTPAVDNSILMDIDFNDWSNWDDFMQDLNMTGDGSNFSI